MNKTKGVVTIDVTLKVKGNGMLQNPMTSETLDQLIGVAAKAAVDKTRSLQEIADSRVLRDEAGNAGIKVEYLTACLSEAGRGVKNGKKQISTASTTTIFAFIDFKGATFYPFTKGTDEYEVDKRRGQLQNGKAAVAVGIVRPLFKKWELKFQIDVDTNADGGCSADNVKQLFVVAGRIVGLGDFRPAKKGPFGMFEVAEWNIVD